MLIRMGGYQPGASVLTQSMQHIADALRHHGTAKIDVDFREDITTAGEMASTMLGMVETGEIDLCYFSSSYLAGRIPALRQLDRPFPSGERREIFAELDSAMGAEIVEAVADATGLRVLAFWDNGLRHISNSRRPIYSPTDCAGLKLRTLDSALHQSVFSAIGFHPVWIDVADLQAAVELGAVDAQENPLTNLVNFGLYRHHRHVSLTGHFQGVACVLVNRAAFDAWPAETRHVVRGAVADATVLQRQLAAAEDDRCLAILQAAGCKIVPREALDLAAFKACITPPPRASTEDILQELPD